MKTYNFEICLAYAKSKNPYFDDTYKIPDAIGTAERVHVWKAKNLNFILTKWNEFENITAVTNF